MVAILVKATVVLFAGALVALAMRRASAASRHLVLMATLVGALVVPIARELLPVLELQILPPVTIHQSRPGPLTTTAGPAAANKQASSTAGAPPSGSTAPSRVLPTLPGLAILALIASGIALLVARGIGGYHARRSLWRNATLCADLRLLRAIERVSGLLGVSRDVVTRVGAVGTMPMTFGAFAPKLVLPADAAAWPADRLDAVLMHELAHVRRWDSVAHAATRAAASLYWYHPLAWWISRQARIDRERACDDVVLQFGIRPSAYAECLLALCAGAPVTTDAVLPMARRAQITDRLSAILDPEQRRHAHSRFSVVVAVVIITSSAVVSAALLTAERINYIERVTSRPPAGSTPPAVRQPAEAGPAAPQSGPRPIPAGQFGAGAHRPGNGVTNPIRIREVKPEYTPAAEREGVQGTIELEAVIGPAGTVTEVRVVRSLDKQFGLDANAIDSVRNTPFVPCKIADKPVACIVVFELQYTLPTPRPIPAGEFGAGAYRLTKHPGFVGPVRLRDIKPQYTPEAMRARIEGTVRAELVILADGTVGDIRIVESLDTVYGLDQQALTSIKAMTFTPAKFNGTAIAVVMPIEQLFTLR